ncbi:MAG: hypothetical protein V3S14_13340 [Anaerolineae bacterium]
MDILQPTPEEMTTTLLESAEAEQWNHWRHEIEQHASDWCDANDMRRALRVDEFADLPKTVAQYPFVELCVYGYGYRGQAVWGFYARKLPFREWVLTNVLVVYNPLSGEIIHCMWPRRKKRYCERWGEQTGTFVRVRW